MNTVIDVFEKIAEKFSSKTAISDGTRSLSYGELAGLSRRIGGSVAVLGAKRQPVCILLERGIEVPAAMLGILMSGNFYVVLDAGSPKERLKKICETMAPAAILTSRELEGTAAELCGAEILLYEECESNAGNADSLSFARVGMTDCDPACAICTSGSTGFPKGVLITHRNILSYIEWFSACFGIDDSAVFGSQTPLYFSMSVSDFYACMLRGGTYIIIPKKLFVFPAELVGFLNRNKVNSLYWVPSAYGIIAKYDLLEEEKFTHLRRALFAGEVMPPAYLCYMRKNTVGVCYANLFGPTETTDICAYYKVPSDFPDGMPVPIGVPCENCRLYIIGDDGKEADCGELYASGSFVAAGYYNNPKATREKFVQNPLNPAYPEILYKTGDLVKRQDDGNLKYIGRCDFQIKRSGYRIEPGEIENAARSIEGLTDAACVFGDDKIVLFYESSKNISATIEGELRQLVPEYMQPDKFVRLRSFPLNQNGKTDRKKLAEMLAEGK